jgi:coproporphyrinogen III oxidase-like Fe-S oxidoreductase
MDMGAQTFDDKLRKMLCLPDSAADVEKAIRHARKLDLCVCVDLMYNLPGQTLESWVATLKKAIALDVEIDTYSLHVDAGTPLEKMIKKGISPPVGDAEFEKELYLAAYKLLTDAGYKAVGHDRFSRVEWHMRENCLNGWPWGGILTTGAGCLWVTAAFQLQQHRRHTRLHGDCQGGQIAHPEAFRIHRRRHDAAGNEQTLPAVARE